MIQAVILVGGMGTRLKSLYPDRPKALVPVLGKPFIQWQIDWLVEQGVDHIHLAAGYRADVLADWIRQNPQPNTKITLFAETSPVGTGGGLKLAEPFIESATFIVLNGDSYVPNLNLADLLDDHSRSDPIVTIAATHIAESGRYGTVEFSETRMLKAFLEKAPREEGWVNAGVYAMQREILGLIEAGKPVSLEKDVFPALSRLLRIRVFPSEPPLLDMGTPEGLAAIESFLSRTG